MEGFVKGSQPQIFAAYNDVCLARETAGQDSDGGSDGNGEKVVVDDKETEDKETESEIGKDVTPAKKEVSFRSKDIKISFGSKPLSNDDDSSPDITIVIILVIALICIAIILAVIYLCNKRKAMPG